MNWAIAYLKLFDYHMFILRKVRVVCDPIDFDMPGGASPICDYCLKNQSLWPVQLESSIPNTMATLWCLGMKHPIYWEITRYRFKPGDSSFISQQVEPISNQINPTSNRSKRMFMSWADLVISCSSQIQWTREEEKEK